MVNLGLFNVDVFDLEFHILGRTFNPRVLMIVIVRRGLRLVRETFA
jgi:hypothetical protein